MEEKSIFLGEQLSFVHIVEGGSVRGREDTSIRVDDKGMGRSYNCQQPPLVFLTTVSRSLTTHRCHGPEADQ